MSKRPEILQRLWCPLCMRPRLGGHPQGLSRCPGWGKPERKLINETLFAFLVLKGAGPPLLLGELGKWVISKRQLGRQTPLILKSLSLNILGPLLEQSAQTCVQVLGRKSAQGICIHSFIHQSHQSLANIECFWCVLCAASSGRNKTWHVLRARALPLLPPRPP